MNLVDKFKQKLTEGMDTLGYLGGGISQTVSDKVTNPYSGNSVANKIIISKPMAKLASAQKNIQDFASGKRNLLSEVDWVANEASRIKNPVVKGAANLGIGQLRTGAMLSQGLRNAAAGGTQIGEGLSYVPKTLTKGLTKEEQQYALGQIGKGVLKTGEGALQTLGANFRMSPFGQSTTLAENTLFEQLGKLRRGERLGVDFSGSAKDMFISDALGIRESHPTASLALDTITNLALGKFEDKLASSFGKVKFKSAEEAIRSAKVALADEFGIKQKFQNNKGKFTSKEKYIKGTRDYSYAGALAGIEPYQDEKGQWKVRINPLKAAIGMGLGKVVSKGGSGNTIEDIARAEEQTLYRGEGSDLQKAVRQSGVDQSLGTGKYYSLTEQGAVPYGKTKAEKVATGNTLDVSKQEDLQNLVNTAIEKYPNVKPEEAISKVAKDMGYDSISDGLNINILGGKKTRKLVTSVQGAENISEQTKQKVASEYIQKPNDQLMGEAKALLTEGGKIDIKNVKNVDQKVAATIQQAINMDKAGDHEAAAALFNNLSEQGTELGRGVQAFSLLKKMSPEAISLSAAGQIKKYNQTAKTKIPELTGEQQKIISDQVNIIRDMPNGREKNIALNELNNTISGFIPSSLTDKVIATWKAGLLTSLRTHERNFVGNLMHQTAEIVKDIPATITDKLLALRTGQRTKTFTAQGLQEFGSKTTQQQMKDIVSKGYDPTQQLEKFDYKKITWGNNPVEQFLKKYTDVVFNTLSASDKPFYNAAMARSLYDQAGAAAINAGKRGDVNFIESLVKSPSEAMVKTAINDANAATFKTTNKATEVASALKRTLGQSALGKFGAEITMPFTGVPTSVSGQVIAYSPIGLVKGIADAGKVAIKNMPDLQRQASQEVGRGVIGTGLIALGSYLASKGIITGQPKDAEEQRLWDAQNKPRNSILIGGKWRSLNSIGPEAIMILAGAKWDEEKKDPEGSASKYAVSLIKDQLDQSYVTGLQAPINAITDPNRYAKSYVGGLISSPIPNIIKDVAKSTDTMQRETNTALDYAKMGLPGLRQTLLPKRNVLGDVMPQEPTGYKAFIDLFNSKTPSDNRITNELSRLSSEGFSYVPSKLSQDQTIQGVKVRLSPKQLDDFEQKTGLLTKVYISEIMDSKEYSNMSDEDKSLAIKNAVDRARKEVRSSSKYEPDVKQPQKFAADVKGAADTVIKPASGEQFTYVEDNKVKYINKRFTHKPPRLTGDMVIDKELLTDYRTKVNSRIREVMKLYEMNQMSKEQASKEIRSLKKINEVITKYTAKPKKAKKIKIKPMKKIKVKTYKMPKVGKFKPKVVKYTKS